MASSMLTNVWLVSMVLVVAGLLVVGVGLVDRGRLPRMALGLASWLAVTGAVAELGLLSFSSRPPTMLVFLLLAMGLTTWLAFSQIGTRLIAGLPIHWVVGVQAFRVPVELWLHRGYEEGVFPVQMTYAGLNYDVISGVTALIVAVLLWKQLVGRRVVLAWNVLGSLLLLNIVGVALLAAPLPFRVFDTGPPNVFVTGFPGIWLPAVLVQVALLGHLLVFRWGRRNRTAD